MVETIWPHLVILGPYVVQDFNWGQPQRQVLPPPVLSDMKYLNFSKLENHLEQFANKVIFFTRILFSFPNCTTLNKSRM